LIAALPFFARVISGRAIWSLIPVGSTVRAVALIVQAALEQIMFKLISQFRNRIRQQEGIDFYVLPFPGFVTDTRSSPVEIQFELDVRNDEHRAAWSKKWRTQAFNEGRYGDQAVEETVSAARAAAIPQKAGAAAEAGAGTAAAKVVRLNGPLAA
jgi:hypothetical protein